MQRPAIPGGEVVAAERDQAAISGGDMDAAVAQPFQVHGPAVLEGHAGNGEDVGTGTMKKAVKIVFGCTGRGLELHAPPLSCGHADGGQRTLVRWQWGAGTAIFPESLQLSVFMDKIPGRKGAERVFAAWRRKIVYGEAATTLRSESVYDLREGDVAGSMVSRVSAKVAHGLKVDAPDMGLAFQAKTDNGEKLVIIDAVNQGRYKDDAYAGQGDVLDGPALGLGERTATQDLVWGVIDPVKLEKDRAEAGVSQMKGQIRIIGQANTIGVELDEGKTGLPGLGDNLYQVLAEGGFPSGDLQVAAIGGLQHLCKHFFYCIKSRLSGAGTGIGETDRAVQVAARGDLNKDCTTALLMAGAQSAGRGTA